MNNMINLQTSKVMIRKSYKIIALALVTIILHASTGLAQQSNTLYYMNKIPQANRMNPANQPYCKFFLGLPVVSSFYFNYGNNGFAIGDLVYPEDGYLKIDANNFFNTLRDVNNISFDTEFNIFSIGFGIKETYFTIHNSVKFDFGFSFPRVFLVWLLREMGTILGPMIQWIYQGLD